MELSDGSPMETSTPITPTCSARPHAADTLPTLSPKGGNVPDLKSASELPHGIKLESVQDSASAGGSCGGGGGVASSTDVVNNNSGLGGQDRKGSGVSEGQLSSGTLSSSVSSKTTAGSLDSSSGSNQNSMLSFTPSLQGRAPSTWSAQDVCLFLSVNDCGACSEVVLRRVRHLPVILQQLCLFGGGGLGIFKGWTSPTSLLVERDCVKKGCTGYKNSWACSEKDEIDSMPRQLGRLYLGKTYKVKTFTVPVRHSFWRIEGKCS